MRLRLLRAIAPIAFACTLLLSARAEKPETTGVYVDRSGQQHSWRITASHALVWDEQPYIPVGGTFAPRSLAEGATEENWKRDVEGLEVLRARGVLDVLINPVVSAADVPAAAWQRLIDYLDGNGFRYGIAFGAGVATPLTGTVVKPASYRIADVRPNREVTWNVSQADRARYLFADGNDGTLLRMGEVRVQDGVATVLADARLPEGAVGLLYPRKTIVASREGALPDIWAGYDVYRDRLLAVFSKVKFGAGLRFFLDPLAYRLGLPGETEYLVPDSPAFRLEFEAYLLRHYPTVDDVMTAWGLVDRDIQDHKQAARMIPLWSGSRGIPAMFDPSSGKVMLIDRDKWYTSRFWIDLRECRNESLLYYMNGVADLLKREVANVPVVFTRTMHHPLFSRPSRVGGFDGLGIAAYAHGSALVTGGADSAYSQCEEASRALWCVVTETLDVGSPAKPQPGYASREALFYDLDWLRRIGAKGFFVNGFQVLPEAEHGHFQLLRAPEQIGWLKEYADRLLAGPNVANSRPAVLPFPTNAAGLIQSGPIGNSGIWWVPSLAPGVPLVFGSSYAGYAISLPDGTVTVLWSLRGPRLTRLFIREPRGVEVTTPDGQKVQTQIDLKNRTVTLTVSEMPVIIRARGQDVTPIEAAEDSIKQLRALVLEGLAAQRPVEQYRAKLSRAEQNMKSKRPEPRLAYMLATEALNDIVDIVQPYTWFEAEQANPHSFSEIVGSEAASGGAYLVLNTDTRPPREGFAAQFRFNVPEEDTYALWVACTPPGSHVSPFAWMVDTGQARTSADAATVGAPYLADRLVWMNLGSVSLTRGVHTLTLRVTDRAADSGRYLLALDSFLVTRSAFTPRGITRPPLPEEPSKNIPPEIRRAVIGKN